MIRFNWHFFNSVTRVATLCVQCVFGGPVEATRRRCQVSPTRLQLVGEPCRCARQRPGRPQGVIHGGRGVDSPGPDLPQPRRLEEVPVPVADPRHQVAVPRHQCLLMHGNHRRSERRLQQPMTSPSPLPRRLCEHAAFAECKQLNKR